MKVKVMHPFAPVVEEASDLDIYLVDASDLMVWMADFKSSITGFMSWSSYLARQLDAYRPYVPLAERGWPPGI